MFPEWIEIFAAGSWTDSQGRTDEWTIDDLQEMVESYDPANPAPIVIGHPETDSPAYGWIESLKVEGEKLLAKPMQLVEEFVDWVKRGLYKKISVRINPDMTLGHVGFLGGTAPAVKGLKPVQFKNEKAGWVFEKETSLSLGDSTSPSNRDDLDNSKKGGNTMYEWLTKMKEAIGLAEKQMTPDPSVKFTEADVTARVKETEEKIRKEAEATFAEAQKRIEAEKKEKEAAQAKLKEIEDTKRKEDIASFNEALCKEGKLTPALRKIIEPVMIAVSNPTQPPLNLRGGEEGLIEFAEGVKKSALDGIKDFLTELPKVVTFKEVTTKEGPGSGGSAGEKLSALTKKKIEGNKDLSYSVAFAEVQRENPELAKEYLAEIKPDKK